MLYRLLLATSILLITMNTQADEVFSHDDWNSVLGEYVNAQGYVDYQRLKSNSATFDRYVQRIESVSPASNPELFPTKADELAYYMNAYNALVFKGVLSRGPEQKSVWRGLVSGYNFFVKMKITVGGKRTNLKKLEDDIIRAKYLDPRIHAAINCASISCPRLPREAFVAATLEQQLDDAMREFVNSELHVTLDQTRRIAKVSKIFKWFKEDFINYEKSNGNLQPSLLHYINQYREMKIPADFKIEFLDYNKKINKQ